MRVVSLIFAVLALTSCATVEPIIQRENVYLYVNCPDAPVVKAISTAPVRPQAIKDVAGVYWVGITPKEYSNLAINTQESIRFIKGQRGQVEYYKQCVLDFNNLIRKADN